MVIVASILLAFGIDAWWDGRQQVGERQELLSTMLESVRLNRESLEENIRRSESAQALSRSFLAMDHSDLAAVPTSEALALTNSLNQPNTRQPSQGPLSRLLDSGRLTVIGDPSIAAAVDLWLVQVAELEERAENLAQVELMALTARAPHDVFRMRNTVDAESRPATVDLRSLRDDEDVVNAANVMLFERNVYILFARRTLETLERLDQLISGILE